MMKRCIAIVLGSLIVGLFVAPTMTHADTHTQEDHREANVSQVQSTSADHLAKSERFLEERIPIGFYLYLYRWKQHKDAAAHDLDDAITQMARDGFNYLYVGGVSDTPLWQHVLELCEKHRIAVVPQLDFAYLSNPQANIDALSAKASAFINKYKDRPAVLAFSIREEPSLELLPALQKYYQGIREYVPDAPLHLLANYLKTLGPLEPPYPDIIGTDRYGFWWEASGHRATPAYALRWYHTQLAAYYQLAAKRGADFQAVFTTCASVVVASPEKLRALYYGPHSDSEEGKSAYVDRVRELAEHENHGWAKADGENLRYWRYYRPPTNTVRAMSWLSIMEGARSVAIWSWVPPESSKPRLEDESSFDELFDADPGTRARGYHLSGPGHPSDKQYAEYVQFASEVQRYAKLIRSMTKVCPPLPEVLPLGHEIANGTDGAHAVFDIHDSDAACQTFNVPGYQGKVVVVVNTAVGSWCDGRSPMYLSGKDRFRINKVGELVDYTPFTEPRSLTCRVVPDEMECIDLNSTTQVDVNRFGYLALPVDPGGGRLLFVTPKGSGEWPRFKREFGL